MVATGPKRCRIVLTTEDTVLTERRRNQLAGRCEDFLFLDTGTAGHGDADILSAMRHAALLIAFRRIDVAASSLGSVLSSKSHSAIMMAKSLFKS